MASQPEDTPIVRLGPVGELFGRADRVIVTVVRVNGTAADVLVLRDRRGRVFAAVNRCPHRGMLLDNAAVLGHTLTCPGHGRSYDLRTGRPTRPGTRPLPVIRGWIEHGEVFLRAGLAATPTRAGVFTRWWRRLQSR